MVGRQRSYKLRQPRSPDQQTTSPKYLRERGEGGKFEHYLRDRVGAIGKVTACKAVR